MSKIVLNLALLYTLVALSEVLCCQRVSFNNVSVTVVGVRGVDRISGCLHPLGPLEKVSYVQIINQSIPILYEDAVRDLQNLVDFILDNSKLEHLHPGAFINLPSLKLLRLKDNRINEIKEDVFSNLPITELNLANNNITSIARKAFDNLTNLEVINLDHNRISVWNPNWFFNSPLVNTISFKDNLITNLPARAFQNVEGVHVIEGRKVMTNIFLNNNEISYVDEKALEGLRTLGWLFLNSNNISRIPDHFLDGLDQIDWLKLNLNRLSCVPHKIFEKISSVGNYLEGNPLDDQCKARYNL